MPSLIKIYVWGYSPCRKPAQRNVYVNESNFLPKEIKMKRIIFLLERTFIHYYIPQIFQPALGFFVQNSKYSFQHTIRIFGNLTCTAELCVKVSLLLSEINANVNVNVRITCIFAIAFQQPRVFRKRSFSNCNQGYVHKVS